MQMAQAPPRRSQDCRAFAGQRSAHKTVEFQKQPDQFGTNLRCSSLDLETVKAARGQVQIIETKSKGVESCTVVNSLGSSVGHWSQTQVSDNRNQGSWSLNSHAIFRLRIAGTSNFSRSSSSSSA
ncbi:unnamed protein product [Sphagnum jensenii]|uniref:Uncharacterized protein n=1 Tax=Sphagnum jensenii TaxID=128206 RepID=A0ABP1BAL7_9BRYO